MYNPPKTYTIVTTYSSNLPVTQTIISGSAGPSPATGSYAYTYSAPLQSASGTDQASLFSSLKANGEPTAYTSSLAPDPNNLQVRIIERSCSTLTMIVDRRWCTYASVRHSRDILHDGCCRRSRCCVYSISETGDRIVHCFRYSTYGSCYNFPPSFILFILYGTISRHMNLCLLTIMWYGASNIICLPKENAYLLVILTYIRCFKTNSSW